MCYRRFISVSISVLDLTVTIYRAQLHLTEILDLKIGNLKILEYDYYFIYSKLKFEKKSFLYC